MTDLCGSVHPDHNYPCERPSDNHPQHSYYFFPLHSLVRWPNEGYKPTVSKRVKKSAGKAANKGRLDLLAKKLRG